MGRRPGPRWRAGHGQASESRAAAAAAAVKPAAASESGEQEPRRLRGDGGPGDHLQLRQAFRRRRDSDRRPSAYSIRRRVRRSPSRSVTVAGPRARYSARAPSQHGVLGPQMTVTGPVTRRDLEA